MSAHQDEERLMAECAASWLDKLKNGTPQERAAAVAWIKQSPRHLRETLLAATWDQALEGLDRDHHIDVDALGALPGGQVTALRADAGGSISSGKYRLAAAFFGLAGILTAFYLIGYDRLSLDSYATSIGELRSVQLEEGSIVELDSASKIKVSLGMATRTVNLVEGQAMFDVAHDAARPFEVRVNGTIVRAIGTKFGVYRKETTLTLAVVEGAVQVLSANRPSSALPPEPLIVKAGESVEVSNDDQKVKPAPLAVAEVVAWRERRLVFRQNPLQDIAVEFNRHNRSPKIELEGDTVKARLYWGVFDANDPESLIEFLKREGGVQVERNGDTLVIRDATNPTVVP